MNNVFYGLRRMWFHVFAHPFEYLLDKIISIFIHLSI